MLGMCRAATPGCTKEACKFRDEYSVFKDAGAEVLGISGDSPDSNAAFAKAQRLNFPLLRCVLCRHAWGCCGGYARPSHSSPAGSNVSWSDCVQR